MEYRNDEKQLNCRGESLLIPGAREKSRMEMLSNRTLELALVLLLRRQRSASLKLVRELGILVP